MDHSGLAWECRRWHGAAAFDKPPRRRSSGVEHTLGKGGVGSSILPGGTIQFLKISIHRPVDVLAISVAQASRLSPIANRAAPSMPGKDEKSAQADYEQS